MGPGCSTVSMKGSQARLKSTRAWRAPAKFKPNGNQVPKSLMYNTQFIGIKIPLNVPGGSVDLVAGAG